MSSLRKLVESYESSDSEGENSSHVVQNEQKRRKRNLDNTTLSDSNSSKICKIKLPIPEVIHEMFKHVEEDHEHNASDYNGKIRSFPHVRGNWASFVYIPLKSCDKLKELIGLVEAIQEDLKYGTILNFEPEPHISLTKTQVLRHHWIDNFHNSLSQKLRFYNKFQITLDSFEVFVNEEKTRTFLAVKVFQTDVLLRLTKDCDTCLLEYGLEPYYEDPSFHISLAWAVGDQTWRLERMLPMLNMEWENITKESTSAANLSVQQLEFKTGNKIYHFAL